MELTSAGIKLSYSSTESGTYKELYGLSKVPSIGGKIPRIDGTGLGDFNRRSIKGIRDFGELNFSFFYNSDAINDNVPSGVTANSFAALYELDKSNAEVWFKLEYPDGSGFNWRGGVSVSMDSAGVGEVLGFTLSVTVLSEIYDV